MSTELQSATAKKQKMVKTDSLRVLRETKKKILSELAILNKKKFGKAITPDQYVSLAISLLQPEHLERLKERSLSNKDRMEQQYHEHCVTHGKVSRDEYLGLLLSKQ